MFTFASLNTILTLFNNSTATKSYVLQQYINLAVNAFNLSYILLKAAEINSYHEKFK